MPSVSVAASIGFEKVTVTTALRSTWLAWLAGLDLHDLRRRRPQQLEVDGGDHLGRPTVHRCGARTGRARGVTRRERRRHADRDRQHVAARRHRLH